MVTTAPEASSAKQNTPSTSHFTTYPHHPIMQFLSKQKDDDFKRVKAWEYSESWDNPFGQNGNDEYGQDEILAVGTVRGERSIGEEDDQEQLKKKKKRKHGKKKKNKRVSDDDASHADSLLSEILSESEVEDMQVDRMTTLNEDMEEILNVEDDTIMDHKPDDEDDDDDAVVDDDDSMQVLASTREIKSYGSVRHNRLGGARSEGGEAVAYRNHSPSKTFRGDKELSPRSRSTQKKHQVVDSSEDEDSIVEGGHNPFNGMNALLKTDKNPFGGDSEGDNDNDSDDSSFMSPPSPNAKSNKNPFSDEDEDDEVASDAEGNMMFGTSFDASDDEHIETSLQESRGKAVSHDSDDEEDIVESSKRLLRMADERIQYQQHSDEVHELKDTVEDMKSKAEAMAEQLRRAVETKCDLVLAQNEMERCHEQDLIAKEDEIKGMRKYVQDLLDTQARSELNFMNEIASLAHQLEVVNARHKKESEAKDGQIAELERKLQLMKTGSVRNNSSRGAFKNCFVDVENRSVGSNSNASSKKGLFI